MSRRTFALAAWTLAGALGVAAGAAHLVGVRVNLTESAPAGLWLVDRAPPAVVSRGLVVSVCPPEQPIVRAMHELGRLQSGSCPVGTIPLLKPVAAIPGDTVTIRAGALALVNGQETRNTLPRAGLPSWPPGTYHVGAGEVWLFSGYSGVSFDSRYFGPVPTAAIRGAARPLWIRGDVAALSHQVDHDRP